MLTSDGSSNLGEAKKSSLESSNRNSDGLLVLIGKVYPELVKVKGLDSDLEK